MPLLDFRKRKYYLKIQSLQKLKRSRKLQFWRSGQCYVWKYRKTSSICDYVVQEHCYSRTKNIISILVPGRPLRVSHRKYCTLYSPHYESTLAYKISLRKTFLALDSSSYRNYNVHTFMACDLYARDLNPSCIRV